MVSAAEQAEFEQNLAQATAAIKDFVSQMMEFEGKTSALDLKIGQTVAESLNAPVNPNLVAQTSGGVDSLVMASVSTTVVGREAIKLARIIGEKVPTSVKVIILCLVMMSIIYGCASGVQPGTAVGIATATSEVTDLPLQSIPTNTQEAPTQTSTATAAPTETSTAVPIKEIKDYPPTNVEGTCTGVFSLENLHEVDILLPNGVHLTRWMECELLTKEKVAMAVTTQELSTGNIYTALGGAASTTSAGKLMPAGVAQGEGAYGLDYLHYQLMTHSNLYLLGKKVQFTFVTGNDSGSYLRFNNPLANVLIGELGNRMVAFAEPVDDTQDDASYLINLPGIPYPVFIPYRLKNFVFLEE